MSLRTRPEHNVRANTNVPHQPRAAASQPHANRRHKKPPCAPSSVGGEGESLTHRESSKAKPLLKDPIAPASVASVDGLQKHTPKCSNTESTPKSPPFLPLSHQGWRTDLPHTPMCRPTALAHRRNTGHQLASPNTTSRARSPTLRPTQPIGRKGFDAERRE